MNGKPTAAGSELEQLKRQHHARYAELAQQLDLDGVRPLGAAAPLPGQGGAGLAMAESLPPVPRAAAMPFGLQAGMGAAAVFSAIEAQLRVSQDARILKKKRQP